MFTFFDKAITSFLMPGLVAAITGVVQGFGVTGNMNWTTAVTMVLTGIMTYLIPNRSH